MRFLVFIPTALLISTASLSSTPTDCVLGSLHDLLSGSEPNKQDYPELVSSLPLMEFTGSTVRRLLEKSEGARPTLQYLIDQDQKLYVVENGFQISPRAQMAQNTNSGELHIISEFGTIRWIARGNKFEFLADPERGKVSGREEVLSCLEILGSLHNKNSLITDAMILAGAGVTVANKAKHGELKTSKQRRSEFLKLGGSATNRIVMLGVGHYMRALDMPFAVDIAVQSSEKTAIAYLHRLFVRDYVDTTRSQKKESLLMQGKLISGFEAYYVTRILYNNLLRPVLLSAISERIYDECADGNKVQVRVGIHSIRLLEQGTWTLLYFGEQKVINK